LLNIVQPITGGCLRNLHTSDGGVAAQYRLQLWRRSQSVLQSFDPDPKSVPRDLYHGLKHTPAQANSRQGSRTALLSHDASFSRFSILHNDDKRNQTSIREIYKF
jgi:hypothetical protein